MSRGSRTGDRSGGTPDVSVVVPTYNRMDTLPEVLDAIARLDGGHCAETIVIDDGSTDDTADLLGAREAAGEIRVLRQQNAGPARARNRGVQAARGELVAFLGDDTVPERGWLTAHLDAHRRRGSAAESGDGTTGGWLGVIGYTAWHPRMRLTPFLRYINEHGLQFGYALIDDPDDVPFNFLYTSNLSLPREALLEEPFDEGFPYPAWEDIEVSYRLFQRGFRLVYEPAARVAHDHPTDLRRFAVRQEKAGYCGVVFHQRHPELGSFLGLSEAGPPPLPSRARQRLRWALARALQHTPLRLPRLWEEILRYHYIEGLRRGWTERVEGTEGERR